ncbi:ankyrin repeat-containing domain protein [Aspergillus transmontanensis]|uniref:Ankyrin repeat-containing domain protein n=1 Tax=Aspergillus transmontanensis TaxID=1034304 RepID=A0A5N6W7S1_9EURO|nr:ankyrin repeat-containing domain protein [Aspergillus transmontanensis]
MLMQLMVSCGVALDTKIEIKDWSIDKVTALSCAVHFKHKNLVETILELSPGSSITDLSLNELEKVILEHDTKMLHLIFNHIPNRSGAKAVQNECMKSILMGHHFETARILLENGASVVQFDEHHTMLRKAVESSDYELAEFLLKNGAPSLAEPVLKDGRPLVYIYDRVYTPRCLPLQMAVIIGDLKMTSLLLQYGATRYLHPISVHEPVENAGKETENTDPVCFAIRDKSLEMLKLLVTEEAHISDFAASLVIKSGWIPGINHFRSINLSYIHSTKFKGAWRSAAISAIGNKSLAQLEFLVTEKSHVSPNIIRQACYDNWARGLKHLLSIDPSLANTVLIELPRRGGLGVDILQVALDSGGDPNYEGEHLYFPLERAVEKGGLAEVRFLLTKGARVDKYHTKDKERRTALYWAVEKAKNTYLLEGSLMVISLLVKEGASTDRVKVGGMGVLSPRRRKILSALRGEWYNGGAPTRNSRNERAL